jgi:hypothetical protein
LTSIVLASFLGGSLPAAAVARPEGGCAAAAASAIPARARRPDRRWRGAGGGVAQGLVRQRGVEQRRPPRATPCRGDYQRIAAMGTNAVATIRLSTFEADAAPGQYLADGWR